MKLLEQYRQACQQKHFARRTIQNYLRWTEEYLRFQRKVSGDWVHPAQMGAAEVEGFLTHLAVNRKVAESTQNQALAALLFLYNHVLKQPVGRLDALRAKRPVHIPTVLSKAEAAHLLAAIPAESAVRLMAELLYGGGLRVSECCEFAISILTGARSSFAAARGTKTASPCCHNPCALGCRRESSMCGYATNGT